MKKIVLVFYIVMLNLFQHPCIAQNKKMDSLKVELSKATQDTTRLKIYISLRNTSSENDYLKYVKIIVGLLDKLIAETKDEKKKKQYFIQKASVYEGSSFFYYQNAKDTAKIFDCMQKRLSIYQEIKDTGKIVNTILITSVFYNNLGYPTKALELSQQGLSVSKKMNYKTGIAQFLNRIGSMYRNQGETKQALENFQQSVSILNEIKDTNNLIEALTSIGTIKRSIEYYSKALVLCNSKRDKIRIGHLFVP